MNDLSVNFEEQTISARDLHEQLNIKTPYTMWFERMREYGFEEGEDFFTKMLESSGGRPSTDHEITVDMAKQICMIQRTPEGKKVREYLISLEKAWNTPELIMARALKMADKQITGLKEDNAKLIEENKELLEENSRYIEEWENNRPIIEDYENLTAMKAKRIPLGDIANELGTSATELTKVLRETGILKGKGKDPSYKDWNKPYQKYIDKGYFVWQRAKTFINHFGEAEIKFWVYALPAGIPFIRDIYENYKNPYPQLTLDLRRAE